MQDATGSFDSAALFLQGRALDFDLERSSEHGSENKVSQ